MSEDYWERERAARDRALAFLAALPTIQSPTACDPAVRHHRQPEGPCEDAGSCGFCWAPGAVLRPAGETFGLHAEDCSLPERHWGWCEPGGAGHPRGMVRGTEEPRNWRAG